MPAIRHLAPLGLLALLTSQSAETATLTVTNLGDAAGNCPSASACTLRAALAAAQSGDLIQFSPSLTLPATITLVGSELSIAQNVTISGPGADRLTVRGAGASRVLNLSTGALVIEDLTLDRGRALATSGMSGNAGLAGQIGSTAEGGCILTAIGTSLVLERVALRDCRAVAGAGGSGGNGVSGPTGGNGGTGGSGGLARGGAIFARGQVTLLESSVSESSALGGSGGVGGQGGPGTGIEGNGGNGGSGGGARGGAIALSGAGAALLLRNSTLTGNQIQGGTGGRGGNGGNGGASGVGDGGNGGGGGLANGGQIHLEMGVGLVDFEFASLGPADAAGGPGGQGGTGDPNGLGGLNGGTNGEVLFSGKSPQVRSSVFAGGNNPADCAGTVTVMASGANFDSDDSCTGFSGNVNFAANFVGPALAFERGRAVLQPRAGAPVIDAASDCLDLDGIAVDQDQSGRERPLDGDGANGAACDAGAIEFSIEIFRDGFETTF